MIEVSWPIAIFYGAAVLVGFVLCYIQGRLADLKHGRGLFKKFLMSIVVESDSEIKCSACGHSHPITDLGDLTITEFLNMYMKNSYKLSAVVKKGRELNLPDILVVKQLLVARDTYFNERINRSTE